MDGDCTEDLRDEVRSAFGVEPRRWPDLVVLELRRVPDRTTLAAG
jgi:hypothetical protein